MRSRACIAIVAQARGLALPDRITTYRQAICARQQPNVPFWRGPHDGPRI